MIDLWYEIFTYPGPTIDWSASAIEKGYEILQEHHIDAIISSMTPVTSHIIANELVKRKKIPWIADFRDLWTQNHYYEHSRIRRFFERKLELTTLFSATALTTISHLLSEKLQELYKNKKVYAIANGYDPEQINPGIPLTKKFTITYTGELIWDARSGAVFKTLKVLIDENMIDPSEIEVHFFGYDEGWLINDIKKSLPRKQYKNSWKNISGRINSKTTRIADPSSLNLIPMKKECILEKFLIISQQEDRSWH